MKYKLSIVIPVWNNFNFTKACVEDLLKLPEDHEIIIIDNASTDATATYQVNDPRVTIHRNSENEGFAKACNKGYQLSSSDIVMFLNNDIRVKSNHKDWTQSIIEAVTDNVLVGPTVGILSKFFAFKVELETAPTSYGKSLGTGHGLNDFPPGLSLASNTQDCKERFYLYVSGWNITANKTTWNKLIEKDDEGPFSTSFFCYFEDTDLSFRAMELGIKASVVEKIPIVHFGRMTSQKLNTAELYSKARNIFLNKWVHKVDPDLAKMWRLPNVVI